MSSNTINTLYTLESVGHHGDNLIPGRGGEEGEGRGGGRGEGRRERGGEEGEGRGGGRGEVRRGEEGEEEESRRWCRIKVTMEKWPWGKVASQQKTLTISSSPVPSLQCTPMTQQRGPL